MNLMDTLPVLFYVTFHLQQMFQPCMLCCAGFCLLWCIKCDRNFAVWEVIREDEFSPLKNADGAAKDTPTTCRQDLCALHLRYAISAGANFVHADGTPYTTFKG